MKKQIIIGCDNAAVELKNLLVTVLKAEGYEYEDLGVYSAQDNTYYPLVAKAVCDRIIESDFTKEGILVCGTGIGMAIAANKFKGIYAAVCHDSFSAERARLSNNTNVLCMGALILGPGLAKKLLLEWLGLTFSSESSLLKVDVIKEIETNNFMS